jgi:glutathione S-transferase
MLQWISFCQRELANEKNLKNLLGMYLSVLNKALSTSTFFVGITLSLADIFVYVNLHPIIKNDKSVTKFSNVLRWFDFIQHDSAVASSGLLEKLTVPFPQKPFTFN